MTLSQALGQLHFAASWGDADQVQNIVQFGLDVNVSVGHYQETALHRAADQGSENVMRILIKAGADINARDRCLNVPLHDAANSGSVDAVRLLLNEGAQVNARNEAGETPLLYASQQNHPKVVRALLDSGADRTLADQKQRVPLDVAHSNEVVQILLTHNVRWTPERHNVMPVPFRRQARAILLLTLRHRSTARPDLPLSLYPLPPADVVPWHRTPFCEFPLEMVYLVLEALCDAHVRVGSEAAWRAA